MKDLHASILIVDDDPSFVDVLKTALISKHHHIESAKTFAKAREALHRVQPFDIVLLDLGLPDGNGLDLIPMVRQRSAVTKLIIVTIAVDIQMAVRAIRSGADEYVTKDLGIEETLRIINKFIVYMVRDREIARLRYSTNTRPRKLFFSENSSAMSRVMEMIREIAPLPTTVLIQGESGTGKELVARELHAQGSKPESPFVTVNLPAVPQALVESTLFGHEKGSFTGASHQYVGKFEAASDGTIFLDEIGSMPIELQAKLLRVMQEREFERVGGSTMIKLNARIVTATHHNLQEEIKKGTFREDLYYRLMVYPIQIPPLRERMDQVPILGKYFLDHYLIEFGKNLVEVDSEVWDFFMKYNWPGNVRELENLMQRLAVHNRGKSITVKDIPVELSKDPPINNGSLRERLDTFEREQITRVLQTFNGNQRKAAEHLKVPLSTFKFKLRRFGITRTSFGAVISLVHPTRS